MAAELFRFMEMAEADAAVDERDIALVTIVEVDDGASRSISSGSAKRLSL